ncbi:MAG: hypothetical protein OEM26_21475 [Saprospiraceae bacterium]|nr:hypothetical protein [Saprospiraceae bacterium]
MPRGTVHDDGGDQLHGRGVGTICVTDLENGGGNPPSHDIYIPFLNSNPRVQIGQTVEFSIRVRQFRALGGKVRYAVNLTDVQGTEDGSARENARTTRDRLERPNGNTTWE